MLNATPNLWRPEDCVLVLLSIVWLVCAALCIFSRGRAASRGSLSSTQEVAPALAPVTVEVVGKYSPSRRIPMDEQDHRASVESVESMESGRCGGYGWGD